MILVDGITDYTGSTKLRRKRWSHMVSTVSDDELHEMARRIGLRRAWHQPASFSHYDVTPPRRARAIELGAVAVPARVLLFMNHDYAKRRRVRPCDVCAEILVTGTTPGTYVDGCMRCDLAPYLAEIERAQRG